MKLPNVARRSSESYREGEEESERDRKILGKFRIVPTFVENLSRNANN